MWSLLAILITIGAGLFVPRLDRASAEAYAASAIVAIVNILVVSAFIFIILRSLWEKWSPRTYQKVTEPIRRYLPKQEQLNTKEIKSFFTMLATGSEVDKQIVFRNLNALWQVSPPYQRRRILQMFMELSQGTDLQDFTSRIQRTESTLSMEMQPVNEN